MLPELLAFRSALVELDRAFTHVDMFTQDEMTRDAVLFRYWRAIDLSVPAIRMALCDWFGESAETLTIGELLRVARARGLMPDADLWLPFFATRFDPPQLLEPARAFDQARTFIACAKLLLQVLDKTERREASARMSLQRFQEPST